MYISLHNNVVFGFNRFLGPISTYIKSCIILNYSLVCCTISINIFMKVTSQSSILFLLILKAKNLLKSPYFAKFPSWSLYLSNLWFNIGQIHNHIVDQTWDRNIDQSYSNHLQTYVDKKIWSKCFVVTISINRSFSYTVKLRLNAAL